MAFKGCQSFIYFDENEQQSLYLALASDECSVILPLKKKKDDDVHVFTS